VNEICNTSEITIGSFSIEDWRQSMESSVSCGVKAVITVILEMRLYSKFIYGKEEQTVKQEKITGKP
jgi:hypothetical protein